MKRALVLAYGALAYLGFLAVFAVVTDFLAVAGFVRGIDDGVGTPLAQALAIDLGLIALFGVSHSVLARPAVKRRLERVIPPMIERSTYVLVADAVLALTVWQWRALPDRLWTVSSVGAAYALWVLFAVGIAIVVIATFLTDHFDLFGLRQVWLYARGRPYTPVPFRERGLYRWVRHPMMMGLLVCLWATPTMTVGHGLFAAGMSLYIFVGVALEDRDLARSLGEPYQRYRRRVGAFLPMRRGDST